MPTPQSTWKLQECRSHMDITPEKGHLESEAANTHHEMQHHQKKLHFTGKQTVGHYFHAQKYLHNETTSLRYRR